MNFLGNSFNSSHSQLTTFSLGCFVLEERRLSKKCEWNILSTFYDDYSVIYIHESHVVSISAATPLSSSLPVLK